MTDFGLVPATAEAGGAMAYCNLCPWNEHRESEMVAQWAAVWHVYQEHYSVWRNVVGNRPPQDPNPGRLP